MNKRVLYLALVILSVAAATLTLLHFKRAQVIAELAVRPGELSQSHAFLGNNCAACHTPVKGVEAKNCIVCHTNNQALLQRQPTAFHAEIGSCVTCHTEHQGHVARITQMDHAALTQISASTEATALSKDLRRRGWAFVGPTTVYAFMQAMGLVNDHLEGCDLRQEAERDRAAFRRPLP